MAHAVRCGWQKQGQFDGAFNWCSKEFGTIAFCKTFNINKISMLIIDEYVGRSFAFMSEHSNL